MHIETTVTERELKQIGYRISRLPVLFVILVICSALIIVTLLLGFIYLGAVDFGIFRDKDFLIALGLFILVWIIYFWVRYSIGNQTKKNLKNVGGVLTYVFDFGADEVSANTNLSKGTVSWKAFSKWRKVADHYLIYVNPFSFWPIKSNDVPPNRLQEFESLLTRKIGPMAKR